MKKLTKAIGNLSIRIKFVIVFVLTSLILLVVNTFMFYNINRITLRLDEIYISNVKLNTMTDVLGRVQGSMTEYLNTKTSDAIEDYYRNEEEFSGLIHELESNTTDSGLRLMERNIRYMSESYIELTGKTIEAKRGRNVEKYKKYYEEATELYLYLGEYLTGLNSEKFRINTESYELLSSSLRYLEWFSIMIFLVLGLFNVLLVLLVTGSITRPLLELSGVADQVSKGDFDVDVVPVRFKDEVGVVTSAFNKMVDSIRDHIARLRESMEKEQFMIEKSLKMEAHLKDAQLKYLQAQINPHFLFNTLNAGAQLAMMEGADRTYDYIQNVADFFRYNIKKDNDVVTLADEIRLVDNYIYILNVRFSGDIRFTKDVDEELLHIKVPSMILQPIVENSVNYGIRDIDWEGCIKLSVHREADKVQICISDNGAGMEQERVKEVMEGKIPEPRGDSDSNGVGLNNVMGRLHLFFEGNNEFEIVSEGKNKGTKVYITVPYGEE
ncbi:MAG: histidine kinase [Lachnospiraceae bacterium]|nr:histidine kinase [Lachnospiraceae bacterium]